MKIKLIPLENNASSSFIDLTIIPSSYTESYIRDDEMIHHLHPSLAAGEPIIGVDVIFARDIVSEHDDVTPWIWFYNELTDDDSRPIYGESIHLQPWDIEQIVKIYAQYATKYGDLMYTREMVKPLAKIINGISDSDYIVLFTYHKNRRD